MTSRMIVKIEILMRSPTINKITPSTIMVVRPLPGVISPGRVTDVVTQTTAPGPTRKTSGPAASPSVWAKGSGGLLKIAGRSCALLWESAPPRDTQPRTPGSTARSAVCVTDVAAWLHAVTGAVTAARMPRLQAWTREVAIYRPYGAVSR